ncbi:MAG: fibronectin type III domain-containing protein [Bacteroidales bacterium]|nr:fibronectin type III domain-containing protein [Bacteroidales bacterium]MBS3776435.1 fibronectin type III domain-containing protein [Bacteroidales bacterium]
MANGLTETTDSLCIEKIIPSISDTSMIFEDFQFEYDTPKGKYGQKFQPKKDYNQLWIVAYQYSLDNSGGFYFKEIEIEDYGKDTEPPDAPSNLQSSEITTNSFKLTWNEPDDNYDGVDKYTINVDGETYPSDTTFIKIEGLNKSCYTYSVKVQAIDVAGNKSAYSDTINVTTRFDEPILDMTVSSGGPLCNNSSKQFSTTEYDDVTYNWTHGNGITLSDENGPSTTATANTTYNGNSYVRVERSFHKSCPGGEGEEATSQKTHSLWVGVPTPDKIEYVNIGPHYPQYSEEICYDYPNDGEVEWTGNGSVTEYEWDAGNWMVEQHPSVLFPEIPMRFVQITAPSWGYDDPLYVTVKAKNSCGWGSNKLPAVVLDAVSCDDFFTLSPNPSNNYVEISPKQNEDQMQTASILNSNETIQVRFINNYGKVVQSTTFTGSTQRINTSDLDEGVYLVEIQINDHVESHRLMVQH